MPDRPVCDFQTDMVEIIVMTTKNHTQQHFRAISNQPKGALPNYKTHLGMIHCGSVTKLLQKSSQALKTFFQLLQIKRLQLKLTNTLQNSYPIQSQHQVPRTWVKQHPKTPQTTKTNENPSPSSSMHKLVPFGSKLVPTWFL